MRSKRLKRCAVPSITTLIRSNIWRNKVEGVINIRIDGIPEEEAETWDNTETKVKEILKEKLNLEEEPDIARTHRVGRRANGSVRRPRTIVCRLRDWKQKEQIIRSARRIKPPGIFVNEDLAQETLDNREEQRPKFEEARRNGKIAYFVLDRLAIKDKIEGPSYVAV